MVVPFRKVTRLVGVTEGEPGALLGVTTAVSNTGEFAEPVVGVTVRVVLVGTVVPVPVRLMVWVVPETPPELSVMVTVAVAAPNAFGVKETAM